MYYYIGESEMLPSSTSPIPEKRSKFNISAHLPTTSLNTGPFQQASSLSTENVMLPMQPSGQCSSHHGFMPRPPITHPAFSFMQPPVESMFAGRKMYPDLNDFWKNKNNYLYNPLNFLWAKKIGLYQDHQHFQSLPAITHANLDFSQKTDTTNSSIIKNKDPSLGMMPWNTSFLSSDMRNQKTDMNATNAHYSAFKPVSRLPYDSVMPTEKYSPTYMWSPAKELMVSALTRPRSEGSDASPLIGSDESADDYHDRNRSENEGSDIIGQEEDTVNNSFYNEYLYIK